MDDDGSILETPTANHEKLQFGAKQIVKQLDKKGK
ncbi:DNA topoisomerase IV subunit B [Lacticaseibacillus paracasei subsp. paracasei CNCM I-2877]|nr:DNA topoisomerase IV subunit B [Lacticaseibacillus paracasei subsp. paracasei CNCM I-2877]